MEKLANRSNGLGQADIGGMPCALARHPVRKAKKQRSAIAPKNEATSILENLAIREILYSKSTEGNHSNEKPSGRTFKAGQFQDHVLPFLTPVDRVSGCVRGSAKLCKLEHTSLAIAGVRRESLKPTASYPTA
jgi:hypothetical protein